MAVAVVVAAFLSGVSTVLAAWIAVRQQQVRRELNGTDELVRRLLDELTSQQSTSHRRT